MKKKTYYLQYNEDIGHKMISDERNSDYLVENSVDATTWIEAKQLLGYPLTGTQELIMENQNV